MRLPFNESEPEIIAANDREIALVMTLCLVSLCAFIACSVWVITAVNDSLDIQTRVKACLNCHTHPQK